MAIEPETGKILAMVSLPSYDPNELASHDFPAVLETYEALDAAEDEPLVNRAIQDHAAARARRSSWSPPPRRSRAASTRPTDEVPGGATYQLPQTSGSTG